MCRSSCREYLNVVFLLSLENAFRNLYFQILYSIFLCSPSVKSLWPEGQMSSCSLSSFLLSAFSCCLYPFHPISAYPPRKVVGKWRASRPRKRPEVPEVKLFWKDGSGGHVSRVEFQVPWKQLAMPASSLVHTHFQSTMVLKARSVKNRWSPRGPRGIALALSIPSHYLLSHSSTPELDGEVSEPGISAVSYCLMTEGRKNRFRIRVGSFLC